jgi:TetR/AcrR family transcriptional regulator, transcriptional repressor of bet genes
VFVVRITDASWRCPQEFLHRRGLQVVHVDKVAASLAERLEAAVLTSAGGEERSTEASPGRGSASSTSESRSDDLIEATVWMVAVHGISGATIERIADAAHVSRGLPRHYFRTKDQLLTAAYERLAVDFVVTLRQGAERAGGNPLAGLDEAIAAVFNPPHLNVGRLRAWFGFWHASPRNRSFTEVGRWVSESHRAILEDLLARAARDCGSEIDVGAAARGLSLLMDGAFVALAGNSDTLTTATAEKLCRDYVQRALGVESLGTTAGEAAEAR